MVASPIAAVIKPHKADRSLGATRGVESAAFWTKSLPISDLRDWQRDALKQLREVRDLPADWDGYGSPVLSERAIEQACCLIFAVEVEDLPTPHIGPGSGGAVQIDWSNGRYALELHFLSNGTASFLKLDNGDCEEDGELPSGAINDWRLLVAWLQEG